MVGQTNFEKSEVLWTPEHLHMIGENKAILAFDVLDEMFWITPNIRSKVMKLEPSNIERHTLADIFIYSDRPDPKSKRYSKITPMMCDEYIYNIKKYVEQPRATPLCLSFTCEPIDRAMPICNILWTTGGELKMYSNSKVYHNVPFTINIQYKLLNVFAMIKKHLLQFDANIKTYKQVYDDKDLAINDIPIRIITIDNE